MTINRLDNKTIEKIAAGEVIESPVSIVKELVENAIDAKAKNITVEIKNGGKSYIRVTDDGTGIDKDEMLLAFDKHTTSKIVNFEDLYDIYSLGFRGEALSSIITVSDVIAISKTKDSDIGKKIHFENNKITEASIATNKGSSFIVTNLFKNIPVRRKFLRSDLIESNNITKLMYALSIGNKNIAFKYIKDERVEFQTNLNEPLDIRISNLLDENLKDNLIKINKSDDIYEIEGYISSSNYYRGNRSLEYLYVNDRLVESNEITNAIEREYKSFIPSNRFPAFFIFIKSSPKNLDVNIHPNKRVIKFSYSDELLNLISKTVYEALLKLAKPNEIKTYDSNKNELLDFNDYNSILEKYNPSNHVREDISSYENDDFFNTAYDISKDIYKEEYEDLSMKNEYSMIKEKIDEVIDHALYITTIFAKFSLFIKDEKILIMDHRRADESIKYNKFLNYLKENKVDSQILLTPIIINLKGEDREKFIEKRDFINDLGFEIEPIGDDKIIIRAVPFIFEIPENSDFFYNLLDIDYSDRTEIFYKKLYKLTKKFAFRKGQIADEMSAKELLNELMKLSNPYKTYEGKSIIVTIDQTQLEKYFER